MGTQLAYLLIDLHARNLEGLFFPKIGSDQGKKVTVMPPFSFFKAYSRKVGKNTFLLHRVKVKKIVPSFLSANII